MHPYYPTFESSYKWLGYNTFNDKQLDWVNSDRFRASINTLLLPGILPFLPTNPACTFRCGPALASVSTTKTGSLRESVFGILHSTKHGCMPRVTGLLKDTVRVMTIFIGGAVGLVILLFVYLDLTKTPDADVQLGRVDRDTTFYVGTSEGNHEGSGYISVLATGNLDASTASLAINYPESPIQNVNHRFFLRKGAVDMLYQDDFYDSRARVTYRHGTVERGQLRLRVALSLPPEEWGKHPTK